MRNKLKGSLPILVASFLLTTVVGGLWTNAGFAKVDAPVPVPELPTEDDSPVSLPIKPVEPPKKPKPCIKPPYKVVYFDPVEDTVQKGIRDALALSLCGWTGEAPYEDTFNVTSMRLEADWGFVSLTYDTAANVKRRAASEHEVVAESANILYRLTNKQWKAAVHTDSAYNDILWDIPESGLSRESKERLTIKPAPITTTSSRTIATTATTTPNNQQYNGYQLPWPAGDSYRLGSLKWHQNNSIDFVANQSAASSEILAAATGDIVSICHVSSTDQAWIHLNSPDGLFKYLHLSWKSVNSLGHAVGNRIEQGQLMGTLSPNIANKEAPCYMESDTPHLHLTFPYNPFRIDGHYFGSTNAEIPGAFISTQCSPRPKPNASTKPVWVLDTGRSLDGKLQCSIKGDITNLIDDKMGIGDIKIENNVRVTLDTGSDKCLNVPTCSEDDKKHQTRTQLNFDFINNKLQIKNGTTLYIHKDAKLY